MNRCFTRNRTETIIFSGIKSVDSPCYKCRATSITHNFLCKSIELFQRDEVTHLYRVLQKDVVLLNTCKEVYF